MTKDAFNGKSTQTPSENQLVAVFSPESNGFVVVPANETLPEATLDGGPVSLEYSHGN